ncbi:hypothetical protein [Pseudoxanthomonas mexicana]|uniref:hypothetical protein n=1 Tax=Pseudoxanthomonas mexicana TaxID=128785 RepID=UPI0028ACB2FA|nr:hypothetical protein [Pseudoxanthomonas mexicana]
MAEKSMDIHDLLDRAQLSADQSPKTHILYEYEGERSIDVDVMIENGIFLWHDLIHASELDDISPLWNLASSLLESTPRTTPQSTVDALRQQIILEAIVPDGWDFKKFRAYKGTLISAIYFHEARRLYAKGEIDRAWHVTTTAYYYLGTSTTMSASRFLAKASARNHDEDTEYQRSLVLWILDQLKSDKHVTSIEKAKDAVIAFIRKREKLQSEFTKLDRLSSSPKHKTEHDALDRLRNTLDDWAIHRPLESATLWEASLGFSARSLVSVSM